MYLNIYIAKYIARLYMQNNTACLMNLTRSVKKNNIIAYIIYACMIICMHDAHAVIQLFTGLVKGLPKSTVFGYI